MAPGSLATRLEVLSPFPSVRHQHLRNHSGFLRILAILSPVIAHILLKCPITMHDRYATSVPMGQVSQILMLSCEHGNLLVSTFLPSLTSTCVVSHLQALGQVYPGQITIPELSLSTRTVGSSIPCSATVFLGWASG